MVADDAQDFADYRDAIEGMLLNGEELEAVFPAVSEPAADSDGPKAIAMTSHRLIVCFRRLRSGSYDRWTLRSILFTGIEEIELFRGEQFHRDRIDATASVTIRLRHQDGGAGRDVTLEYRDGVLAREVHDRILAHMLVV